MKDLRSSRAPESGTAGTQRAGELQALLARVEAAKGPDRELDALIFCALPPPQFAGAKALRTAPGRVSAYGTNGHFLAPDVTRSLDAALALVERVLPGWGCTVTVPLGGGGYAHVFDKTGREYDRHGEIGALSEWLDAGPCHSATPALALLAALLKALIANAPVSSQGEA